MLQTLDLHPSDLGLPEKFTGFRPAQQDAVARINDFQGRFVTVSMPTGGGKSLTYIAAALFAGYRVCVLTMTKALQTQLLEDFGGCGLVDCRGRANFTCLKRPNSNCDQGSTAGCRAQMACPYRQQLEEAKNSQLVVTNLAYWIAMHQYGDGLGTFDMLIIDEAHEAPEAVCAAAAVEIEEREVLTLLKTRPPAEDMVAGSWSVWAEAELPKARSRADKLKANLATSGGGSDAEVANVKMWNNLVSKLEALAYVNFDWGCDRLRYGWNIEPLRAADHAERLLFLGIDRILLCSATLTRKTIQLLGIPDPAESDDVLHLDYPSDFPPQRNYLTYIPTINVSAKMGADEQARWLERIDSIIEARTDRKGIIHTTSYARTKLILERSRFSHMMLSYDSRDAQATIEHFKSTDQPCILIGPSITTGYDFPGTQCEYQILAKVPFPDTRSPILAARCAHDKSYSDYITMQTLIQTCGRAMRFKMDHCENFIVDDNIRWFMSRAGNTQAPNWFRRTYRKSDKIPAPPQRLLTAVSK